MVPLSVLGKGEESYDVGKLIGKGGCAWICDRRFGHTGVCTWVYDRRFGHIYVAVLVTFVFAPGYMIGVLVTYGIHLDVWYACWAHVWLP